MIQLTNYNGWWKQNGLVWSLLSNFKLQPSALEVPGWILKDLLLSLLMPKHLLLLLLCPFPLHMSFCVQGGPTQWELVQLLHLFQKEQILRQQAACGRNSILQHSFVSCPAQWRQPRGYDCRWKLVVDGWCRTRDRLEPTSQIWTHTNTWNRAHPKPEPEVMT